MPARTVPSPGVGPKRRRVDKPGLGAPPNARGKVVPVAAPPEDRFVTVNAGGTVYRPQRATLLARPSTLCAMLDPHSGWRSLGPDEPVRLDVDGPLFAHVITFLERGDLADDLSPSTVSGLAKMGDLLAMEDLWLAAKLHPWRRALKRAVHPNDNLLATLRCADELYLRGRHAQADALWRKTHNQLHVAFVPVLKERLRLAHTPIHRGALNLHIAVALQKSSGLGFLAQVFEAAPTAAFSAHVMEAVRALPGSRLPVLLLAACTVPPPGMEAEDFHRWKLAQCGLMQARRPQDVEALVALGAVQLQGQQMDAAAKSCLRALHLDGQDLSALRQLIDIRMQQGAWHEAQQHLDALRTSDTARAWALFAHRAARRIAAQASSNV